MLPQPYALIEINSMSTRARKYAPGNVYAFKITKDRFAFARLVFMIPKAIHLVEIFDHLSRSPSFSDDILSSPVLIPYECVYLNVLTGNPFNWELIHKDPSYVPDMEKAGALELVTGVRTVSKFDPEFVENEEGRMLWREKRMISEREYLRMNNSPISMNRALSPDYLIVDLRKRWGLHPYEWPDRKSMYKDFAKDGIYTLPSS